MICLLSLVCQVDCLAVDAAHYANRRRLQTEPAVSPLSEHLSMVDADLCGSIDLRLNLTINAEIALLMREGWMVG